MPNRNSKNLLVGFGVLVILIGIASRFYNITRNDFIFFDEGYYLNQNRAFLDALVKDFPTKLSWIFKAVNILLGLSLHSAKSLWTFLVDSRVFLGVYPCWFFPRVVSAICGVLTLAVVFVFARRLFNSFWVGFLSMAVMAIMPGAVFYSRLGLQESASALCFLLGFYFYIFQEKLNYKTALSAIFLASACLMNYRLIILPVLILVSELYYVKFACGERPGARKYVWHTLAFLTLIILMGSLFRGALMVNMYGWIFYQAGLAQLKLAWFNLLSFPFYMVNLQNQFLALLFFGNLYYAFRKQWLRFFPFVIVMAHMAIFSFAADQGIRYLYVISPFRAMAAASLLYYLWEEAANPLFRRGVIAFGLLTFTVCSVSTVKIALNTSDYRSAMEYLQTLEPNPKAIGTQAYVENLYTQNQRDVLPCPDSFQLMFVAYKKGYHYLILDPQAYVSWTVDGQRFTPQLNGPLEFIRNHVRPIKTFKNFDKVLLKRFAFEHNDNLPRTLAFLNNKKGHFGEIRIYSMRDIFNKLSQQTRN